MPRLRIAHTVHPPQRPSYLQWCLMLNVSRMYFGKPDEWRIIKEAWAFGKSTSVDDIISLVKEMEKRRHAMPSDPSSFVRGGVLSNYTGRNGEPIIGR